MPFSEVYFDDEGRYRVKDACVVKAEVRLMVIMISKELQSHVVVSNNERIYVVRIHSEHFGVVLTFHV